MEAWAWQYFARRVLVNTSWMVSILNHCHAYFSLSIEFKITLTILTTIAPPKAGQNPPTKKPSSREEVNPKIMAFITKVNNPSVNIFNGNVKTIKMGLIEMFNNPKIIDAINKSEKSLNSIPENIKLAVPRDNEFIPNRKTMFLNKLLSFF